ncbi:MAG: DinB family protein [Phycisphaeraceae bacterium]|nr:DinB family protein [Phycisphaeraceae bacterium]
MIEALLTISERNLDYARKLLADLPEEKMTAVPAGTEKMNHAAWILGHLAFVADFYGSQLGLPAKAPKEWQDMFSMTSKPEYRQGLYPAKAVMLKVLEDSHARIAGFARQQSAEFWTKPPTLERWKARFPTMAHVAVHIMVNHEAIHLGQLSAWRRAMGLPAV